MHCSSSIPSLFEKNYNFKECYCSKHVFEKDTLRMVNNANITLCWNPRFRPIRQYYQWFSLFFFQRYMDPLKTVSGIDERVVDNIFYMIPEILTHHQIYLEFLNQVWTRWNTDSSTVGDLMQKTVSIQCYLCHLYKVLWNVKVLCSSTSQDRSLTNSNL